MFWSTSRISRFTLPLSCVIDLLELFTCVVRNCSPCAV
nr:MAG TPA: hypothetical protein [Bacteriophage sp.]